MRPARPVATGMVWEFRTITLQFGSSQIHDTERGRPFSFWVDPTLDLVLAPRSPLQQYVKTLYKKQKAIAKFFGHAANLNDATRPQYGGTRATAVGFETPASMLEAKFIWFASISVPGFESVSFCSSFEQSLRGIKLFIISVFPSCLVVISC